MTPDEDYCVRISDPSKDGGRPRKPSFATQAPRLSLEYFPIRNP